MSHGNPNLAKRLAVVSRIARVTSASLGLDELMQVVYDAIAPFFEHEAYVVTRYLRASDSLRTLFGVETGEQIEGAEISLGGFSGVVVREGRPLYVPDLDAPSASVPEPIVVGRRIPIGSWLGVPLRIRGQAVGVLAIAATTKNAYDEEDEQLLTTVADQLAVAIDNARLFEETRGQAERLALLNRVSNAVSSTLDLNELLEALYREISSAFDHDAFLVILHEEESNELELLFGVEDGVRLPSERRSFGGFTGVVIGERRTLHIRNFAAEKEHLPVPNQVAGTTLVHASWLGVPLAVGERVLGALCIMVDRPNAYDLDKERLFETLADQIAFAISNAELFRSVRDAAERLGIVNRIGRAVGREHDLGQLAETVYREIAPVFEANTFFIALVNEEETSIEFPLMIDEGKRVDSDPIPIGEGLTSTVIRTKKMLHVRSPEEYAWATGKPALFGSMRAPATWLGIPLFAEGRVFGVINVQSYQSYAYTEDQALLLATIADQIAMSFEKARLYRAAQREIEERMRAEERLAEERTLLRTIIDSIPDFIYAKDLDGRFVVANSAIARGMDVRDSSELLGKTDADFYPEELAAQFRADEEAVIRSGEPIVDREEPSMKLATGEKGWSLTTKMLLRDDRGTVYGTVGVGRDITSRKQAEERLEEERTLLRTIIDNLPDFIYAKDLDGRFVVANSAIAGFFGCEALDDLLGKTIGDLLPEDEARGFLAEEKEILASGNPVLNQEEYVVDRSSSEPRWLLVTKLPLTDARGDTVGLVGIDRDVTARKRAEEEIRRYLAEVEVANEEVKQFAYIVSHDLRAPLVNLKGFSAELKDAMETLSPHLERLIEGMEEADRAELVALVKEDIPEALGFIDTSVSRMDGFIHSVLKLSRLGRRELTLQPVDVAEFVETCRQSLAHQMEERGAELIVGDLPQVVADPTAMEQIIGNILTNAVNYLDPERPGRIEIGGERTSLETRFWIKDNGRGIAEEDGEKVFAPFRRAGTQEVAGEGMGLSYVRTLVRQHGGRIWYDSLPGVGTTFHFTIANQQREGTPHGKRE